MRYRNILVAASVAALALLCSCSILSGTYSSITPHIEASSVQSSGNLAEPQVSDYEGLRSAIVRIVESGAPSGTIRITRYTDDVQSDVLTACREVQASEPLGAYAVEYMSYDCINVLTHYEATIEVTYRKTPEQIAQIVDVMGAQEFEDLLSSALNNHRESLVVNVRYYYAEQYDAVAMSRNLLIASPASFVAQPEIEVSVYPEEENTRWSKILEVQINWGFTWNELWQRQGDFVSACSGIVAGLNQDGDEVEKVRGVLAWFEQVSLTESEEESNSNTPYSALVERVSGSRGIACAVAALCDVIGVERRVVTGTLDGETHYWNMLRIGRDWYHVDASRSQELYNDSEFYDGYEWVITNYPVCRGQSLSQSGGGQVANDPAAGSEN